MTRLRRKAARRQDGSSVFLQDRSGRCGCHNRCYAGSELQQQADGCHPVCSDVVAEQTGADIQRITVADDHYPVQYNALADVAKAERDNNEHPALTSTHDLNGYDNIILGMPVWWYTMPMPVYSFLDMVDMSGKNVYVFTTHEGSSLNGTPRRVQDVEPDALVSSDGWASRGGQVQQNASTLTGWLEQHNL